MAKHYINFDEKVYKIDEANLAPATDALKAHLETLGGGGGEGTLEYDKEAQFKEVITSADLIKYLKAIESYKDVYAPQGVTMYADESLQLDMLIGIQDPTATLVIQLFMTTDMFVENDTDFAFIYENMGNIGAGISMTVDNKAFVYLLNNETIKLFEGKVANLDPYMSLTDGWYEADISDPQNPTFITTDAPTVTFEKDVVTIEPDISVYSSFFDLGGSSGNLDITLDGAVYKVDSTKLAPATSSLIAHLETLKGGEEGGSGLEYGKEYTFKPNLTMDDFATYVKDATPYMSVGNGGIYYVVDVRRIGDYSDGIALSYWGGGEIEPGVSFEPCAILQILNYNLQKDYRYVINASVAGEVFGGASTYVDGDGWYSSNYGEKTAKTGEVGKYTIPADVAMANTLENTTILFDVSGAGGNGLEFGKEYKFKDVITEADCEAYVANATPFVEEDSQTAYLIAGTSWGLLRISSGDPSIIIWWIRDAENNTASYFINGSAFNPAIPDNCWVSEAMEPIEAPTIIIPEGATMSADLETTAIFFDIPTSGNEGDTKIVINGVEYWVDSAKLADAKSALAEHLKTLEQGSVNLIAFTIDGTSYEAKDGMTWAEWVESAYNPADFSVQYDTVRTGNSPYHDYVTYEWVRVTPTDIIVNGRVYETETWTSGGSNE